METCVDVTAGAVVLRLHGSFDARSTAVVRTDLYRLLGVHDRVVLDLTDVDSVDLTALKVVAAASRHAARRGGRVSVRGCNAGVRRLLALSHLRRLIQVEHEVLV